MFRELLLKEFAPHVKLTECQAAAAERHYELLLRWNARMNLTRITSVEDAVRLHYCESFLAGLQLPSGVLRVADVGSGPGFPGIPMAILRPDIEMTLIESNLRKCAFLREAAGQLKNVQVLPARVEDCKERFDWAVSRAVRPSDVIQSEIAPNILLLIAASDVPAGWKSSTSPWGSGHVVAVSRETFPRETPPC